MALFLGGPADGWRIEIDTSHKRVDIPINPHPPAFTSDKAVLQAEATPVYTYKRERIDYEGYEYILYIPEDWSCADVIEALITGYKIEKNRERLKYVRTAEGQLYANDDRIPAGRPYRI